MGIAEGVAAAVRRRQREREPRVIVLGGGGERRVVAPSAPGYDALLDVADAMLAAGGADSRAPRPRASQRSSRGTRADEPAA